jgi:hypothetical protein
VSKPPVAVARVPCSTCPYRRDAPSGLWSEAEYDKLPRYDGTTGDQAMAGAFGVFYCHQLTGHLCAGWVGCHDMVHNLALRMAVVRGEAIDLGAVHGYRSPVALFPTGAAAAEHGKRDLAAPGPEAQRKARSLLGVLRRRGRRQG